MSKAPKHKPGIGHNGGLPTREIVLQCLARQILLDEEAAKFREKRKMARSGFEAKGVNLEDLDRLNKMKKEPFSAIINWIRRQANSFGALFQGVQMDFFKANIEPDRLATYRTLGTMAGITGENDTPPPSVQGEELQEWLGGHAEGANARLSEIKAALEDGAAAKKSTMPSGAPPVSADVKDKSAKDFAKDEGEDPLVVNGEKYGSIRQANAARKRIEEQAAAKASDDAAAKAENTEANPGDAVNDVVPFTFDYSGLDEDPENWFAADIDRFREWFNGLPLDAAVAFDSPAVMMFFMKLRDGAAPNPDVTTLPGHAPAGTVYRLTGDEPVGLKNKTYKDGKAFSTVMGTNTEVPFYAQHTPTKPKPQSAEASEKREKAGLN